METLKIARQVTLLSEIIIDMKEKKERVKSLNKYDHTETGTSASGRPFFVELGGGAVHVKYYPKDNDIGNEIESFFTSMFDEIQGTAEEELLALIKDPDNN